MDPLKKAQEEHTALCILLNESNAKLEVLNTKNEALCIQLLKERAAATSMFSNIAEFNMVYEYLCDLRNKGVPLEKYI